MYIPILHVITLQIKQIKKEKLSPRVSIMACNYVMAHLNKSTPVNNGSLLTLWHALNLSHTLCYGFLFPFSKH